MKVTYERGNRSMRRANEKGQSTLEFAILIGVIVLCFVAMSNYVKYAATGRLKSSADSISQTLFNPAAGSTELKVIRKTQDITDITGQNTSDTLGTDSTTRLDKLN